MQKGQYKEALEEAVYTLHEAETQLFTALVNIGFSGVYEDISKVYEPGETINLEIAMFENTDDANLEMMVKLVNEIFKIKQSLINLNSLEVNLEEEDDEEDGTGDNNEEKR